MSTTKRSPSPSATTDSTKKPKTNAPKSFLPSLFDPETIPSLNEAYKTSKPYTHAVVEGLFQDDLLRRVKDEVAMKPGDEEAGLGGLVGWGSKETDIYKINQSFDLSSLTPEHLPEATLGKLPALQELRDALYCPEFRNWVRDVTGCGPLSQKKVDGSVSRYTKGCHLLLHDDVISTRRISWILYLPSANWQANPTWGGALELYPATNPSTPSSSTTTTDSSSSSEPTKPKTWRDEVGSDVIPGKTIHPKWGQFVFFEVQPGKSYHSVEEVVVGEGKERLSISGWFHKPMEGEEGYKGEEEDEDLSSLKQITHQSLSTVLTPYPDSAPLPLPGTTLSPDEINFLKSYLHPQYLQSSTLSLLSSQFAENSFLMLDKFLHPSLAAPLEALLAEQDKNDGLETRVRGGLIPKQTAGSEMEGWEIVGPSTRQRFLSLTSPPSSSSSSNGTVAPTATQTISSILNKLLPSTAFRSWLAMLTSLLPLAHKLEARRFRPGLDYTLARGEEEDSRLDVRLGLTPGEKWEDIEGGEQFGGWECYLAPPDENEDPAVYQSSKSKPRHPADKLAASSASVADPDDTAIEIDSDDGSPDDAPLLTSQPAFNSLLLVMRDPQVMKFTKYMSAGAPCCRWDVGGEWEVGMVEEEEESEGADGQAE